MAQQRIAAVVVRGQFLFAEQCVDLLVTGATHLQHAPMHIGARELPAGLLVAMKRAGNEMMSGQFHALASAQLATPGVPIVGATQRLASRLSTASLPSTSALWGT